MSGRAAAASAAGADDPLALPRVGGGGAAADATAGAAVSAAGADDPLAAAAAGAKAGAVVSRGSKLAAGAVTDVQVMYVGNVMNNLMPKLDGEGWLRAKMAHHHAKLPLTQHWQQLIIFDLQDVAPQRAAKNVDPSLPVLGPIGIRHRAWLHDQLYVYV